MPVPLLLVVFAVSMSSTALSADMGAEGGDPDDIPAGAILADDEAQFPTDEDGGEGLDGLLGEVTRESRRDRPLAVDVIPVAMGNWVSVKYGVAVSYAQSEDWSWGIEYLTGAEILSMTDVDLDLLRETYVLFPFQWHGGAGSFQWKLAPGWRDLTMNISGTEDPLSVQGAVLDIGLGNRWHYTSEWVFGIDWFEVYIPVGGHKVVGNPGAIEEETGLRTLDRTVDVLKGFPTFTMLKAKIGYAF